MENSDFKNQGHCQSTLICQERMMERIGGEEPSSYIYGIWLMLLTAVTGLLAYIKGRDDDRITALEKKNNEDHAEIWNKKADKEVVDMILQESRDSRREHNDHFRELRDAMARIEGRKHSQRSGD